MLDAYQLGALEELWIVALPLATVTIMFAFFDTPRRGLRHWFVATHPMSFLVAFGFAVIRSPFTQRGQFDPDLLVFHLLMGAGVVAIIAANVLYRGSRWLLGINLFTVLCAVYIEFIGGMAITHDWI